MTTATAKTASAFRASRAIGAMFFSIMGAVWAGLWSTRAFGVNPALLSLTTAIGAIILFCAISVFQRNKSARLMQADSEEKRRADRVFNIVNAGQWVVILVLGNVLANLDLADWVIMMAMFVIGLHFLPLAKVFNYPPNYVTGTALMVWAVAFSLCTAGGPANPIGCLGAGIILWLSAIHGLIVREPRLAAVS